MPVYFFSRWFDNISKADFRYSSKTKILRHSLARPISLISKFHFCLLARQLFFMNPPELIIHIGTMSTFDEIIDTPRTKRSHAAVRELCIFLIASNTSTRVWNYSPQFGQLGDEQSSPGRHRQRWTILAVSKIETSRDITRSANSDNADVSSRSVFRENAR